MQSKESWLYCFGVKVPVKEEQRRVILPHPPLHIHILSYLKIQYLYLQKQSMPQLNISNGAVSAKGIRESDKTSPSMIQEELRVSVD